MASEVGIVNQAIGFIGGNRITSLDDNTPEAKLAKDLYADLRDACLEEGDWSFAIRGYLLAQSTNTVPFGTGKIFPLQRDILRVIHVNDDTHPWVVEERNIITESDRCEATCVIRITNVNLMSSMFRQALAARLAWDMALPITNSQTMANSMFTLYQQKIEFAINKDGMQGTSRKIRAQRFIDVRGAGGTNVAGPTV